MNTITGTPKELEAITGISQAILSTLLRMAEKTGDAKIISQIKPARGKPSNVWEVNKSFTVTIGN